LNNLWRNPNAVTRSAESSAVGGITLNCSGKPEFDNYKKWSRSISEALNTISPDFFHNCWCRKEIFAFKLNGISPKPNGSLLPWGVCK
jgi:hypothetical protein